MTRVRVHDPHGPLVFCNRHDEMTVSSSKVAFEKRELCALLRKRGWLQNYAHNSISLIQLCAELSLSFRKAGVHGFFASTDHKLGMDSGRMCFGGR